MTVGDWLSARTPAAAATACGAAARVHGRAAERSAPRRHTNRLIDTAEALLADLLALGCAQRDRALDLLAIDALVTYAFEAAAESPETLAARATNGDVARSRGSPHPSSVA